MRAQASSREARLRELMYTIRLGAVHKGTQGFIHYSFKDDLLAMLNKQMLPSLATYDAL